MDWVKAYYTEQSRTFASGKITDQHRDTAARIERWCVETGAKSLLELGAGMGGVAAVLAEQGFEVWAVEVNPADCAHARGLARHEVPGSFTVVEGDFYSVELSRQFDLVFYWDGFGVGGDDDQQRLLARIANDWLSPGGTAIIDVFSPWNWMKRSGERREYSSLDGTTWERRIEFDTDTSRFNDHWEPLPGRGEHRTQSLRCYSPADFVLLVRGTGLKVRRLLSMEGLELDFASDPTISKALATTNGFFAELEHDSQ